ncbi:low temperature requirement protein A [Paractinoplanes rishiriensis]|nr:low temperature requirement protein A [Actinoplanes rishiriensis]
MSQQVSGLDPEEQAQLDREDEEGRDLVRPPDVNEESNRSATRLELFFDLAFVLFVARCADILAKDETWPGAFTFIAVVAIGWWSWASAALYANRFDTDDAIFRLLTLTGMAGVVAMAASVDKLDATTSRWFALAYVMLRVVLIVGYLRAWRALPDARRTIRPYLLAHAAGAAVWLTSLAVPTPGRYVLWGIGVAVDLVGPTLAARLKDGIPLHMEHLPERFGLFVILVLGESVAAVVTGIHDAGWQPGIVVTAALAFLIAAALWWSYFALSGGVAKRRLVQEGHERTRQGVHDFFVYAHLPVAVSLATVAVGLEHAIVHGTEGHLSSGTRTVIAFGLAGYLASVALIQAVLARHLRPALLWPGAGVLLIPIVCLFNLRPPVLLAVLAAIMVAGVATGTAQHRAGQIHTAET